jgi:hypothetical protein
MAYFDSNESDELVDVESYLCLPSCGSYATKSTATAYGHTLSKSKTYPNQNPDPDLTFSHNPRSKQKQKPTSKGLQVVFTHVFNCAVLKIQS